MMMVMIAIRTMHVAVIMVLVFMAMRFRMAMVRFGLRNKHPELGRDLKSQPAESRVKLGIGQDIEPC